MVLLGLLMYDMWTEAWPMAVPLSVSGIFVVGFFWVFIIFWKIQKAIRSFAPQSQIFSGFEKIKEMKRYVAVAVLVMSFSVPLIFAKVLQMGPLTFVIGSFNVISFW
jgi:hypothetical protein